MSLPHSEFHPHCPLNQSKKSLAFDKDRKDDKFTPVQRGTGDDRTLYLHMDLAKN